MKNSNFKHAFYYVVAFLLVTSTSLISCEEKKEKKENTEKTVARAEITLKIPGKEEIKTTISDKSVLRFRVGNTLYGIAISDMNAEKKQADIAFIEVADFDKELKVIPKDQLKVVTEKKGIATLAVERNIGVIDVQLNDFSVGGLDMNAASGSCCVTCGNLTACGCAVKMSCGSCCIGQCCGTIEATGSIGPALPEFDFFRNY